MHEYVDMITWERDSSYKSFTMLSPNTESILGIATSCLLADANSLTALILPEDLPLLYTAKTKLKNGVFREVFRINHTKSGLRWIKNKI